jgi:hypothetical protein
MKGVEYVLLEDGIVRDGQVEQSSQKDRRGYVSSSVKRRQIMVLIWYEAGAECFLTRAQMLQVHLRGNWSSMQEGA